MSISLKSNQLKEGTIHSIPETDTSIESLVAKKTIFDTDEQ